jgi:hypothetical protein
VRETFLGPQRLGSVNYVEDQPDKTKRRLPRAVVVVVLLVMLTAVGGGTWFVHHLQGDPHPPIAVQSPVRSTEAWFAAVNAKNMPLAQAHFAPADRALMDWSSWGQPFIDLHCSMTTHSENSAWVYCTFADQNDPSTGMSNVNFWTVELVRDKSGHWLITNYGQG